VAQLFAHNTALHYRKTHGLHVSCGIMFNHESPRRGERFVTRKIAKGLARIKAGLQETLALGDMAAMRDWGYAPEYVEAMWLMLQRDDPDDFVIGTGSCFSVHDFLCRCLNIAALPISVVGWDPSVIRAAEIAYLRANPDKANMLLGWKARTGIHGVAQIMMEAEMKAVGL
jgi:GDPmannose 4,6-dehydratase